MEEEAEASRTSGGKAGLKPILETWSQSSEAVAAWKHKNMAWIADNGLCDVCLFTRRQNKLVGLKRCFIREWDLLTGLITSFGLVKLYSWYPN